MSISLQWWALDDFLKAILRLFVLGIIRNTCIYIDCIKNSFSCIYRELFGELYFNVLQSKTEGRWVRLKLSSQTSEYANSVIWALGNSRPSLGWWQKPPTMNTVTQCGSVCLPICCYAVLSNFYFLCAHHVPRRVVPPVRQVAKHSTDESHSFRTLCTRSCVQALEIDAGQDWSINKQWKRNSQSDGVSREKWLQLAIEPTDDSPKIS